MAAIGTIFTLFLVALVTFHATVEGNHKKFKVIRLEKPKTKGSTSNVTQTPLLDVPLVRGSVDNKAYLTPFILYGQYATQGQFPYQVAVISEGADGGNAFCGGSILDPPCWILTAKHCIPDGVRSIKVYAGSTNWPSAPSQANAALIFSHPDFDISVLKLSSTLPINARVRPVQLEVMGCGNNVLDNQLGKVSGWGKSANSQDSANDLQWVETRAVSNEYCRNYYGGIIVDGLICSISPTGQNGVICYGDSGGPFVLESTGRQIGVNSFVSGSGCMSGAPSGYVRVPCVYDWIQGVIQSGGRCP